MEVLKMTTPKKPQERKVCTRAVLRRFAPDILEASKIWRQLCEDNIVKNGLPPQLDFSGGICVWLRVPRRGVLKRFIIHAEGCCPGNHYVWEATSGPVIEFLISRGVTQCWYENGVGDLPHDGVNFGDPTKGSKPSDDGSND